MHTFDIGSMDRILATCHTKKLKFQDSYILHPHGKIKVDINNKTTFTHIEGDCLISEKIIRDIAVLALDYPYYPVTMEEMT